METEAVNSSQKAHRKRQAGSKLDKKKKKSPADPNLTARQRNPKAFAYHSVNKVARQVRRFVVYYFMLCTILLLAVTEHFHTVGLVSSLKNNPTPVIWSGFFVDVWGTRPNFCWTNMQNETVKLIRKCNCATVSFYLTDLFLSLFRLNSVFQIVIFNYSTIWRAVKSW